MFKDEWNPEWEEVKRWAFDPDSLYPCEDWPLALEDQGLAEKYMYLAVDPACPKRVVFLNALYLLVGDAVRSWQGRGPAPQLDNLFALAESIGHPELSQWASESKALVRDLTTFEYEYWCGKRF